MKLNCHKPGRAGEIQHISVTTVLQQLNGRKITDRYSLKGRSPELIVRGIKFHLSKDHLILSLEYQCAKGRNITKGFEVLVEVFFRSLPRAMKQKVAPMRL